MLAHRMTVAGTEGPVAGSRWVRWRIVQVRLVCRGSSCQLGIQLEVGILEVGPEEVHILGIHPGAGFLEGHLEVQIPEVRLEEGTLGVHLEVDIQEGQLRQQQKYSRRPY